MLSIKNILRKNNKKTIQRRKNSNFSLLPVFSKHNNKKKKKNSDVNMGYGSSNTEILNKHTPYPYDLKIEALDYARKSNENNK